MSVAAAGRLRWIDAVQLAAISSALGIALLVPRLFSDPVGVDPDLLRLSGVALALCVAAFALSALRHSRVIALAMLAVTAAFTTFVGLPDLLVRLHVTVLSGNQMVLISSAAEAILTAAILLVAVRRSAPDPRPRLRVTAYGRSALAWTLAGVVLFFVIILAIPATWLGRLAVEPVALGRDMVWMAPASVLQAVAQELQFRGLLLGALERRLPPWTANVLQSALFGLAHIAVQYQGPSGPFVPVTFALGLIFGWVTQRTRSVWPAVIVHAVADIGVSAAVIPGLYGF